MHSCIHAFIMWLAHCHSSYIPSGGILCFYWHNGYQMKYSVGKRWCNHFKGTWIGIGIVIFLRIPNPSIDTIQCPLVDKLWHRNTMDYCHLLCCCYTDTCHLVHIKWTELASLAVQQPRSHLNALKWVYTTCLLHQIKDRDLNVEWVSIEVLNWYQYHFKGTKTGTGIIIF